MYLPPLKQVQPKVNQVKEKQGKVDVTYHQRKVHQRHTATVNRLQQQVQVQVISCYLKDAHVHAFALHQLKIMHMLYLKPVVVKVVKVENPKNPDVNYYRRMYVFVIMLEYLRIHYMFLQIHIVKANQEKEGVLLIKLVSDNNTGEMRVCL